MRTGMICWRYCERTTRCWSVTRSKPFGVRVRIATQNCAPSGWRKARLYKLTHTQTRKRRCITLAANHQQISHIDQAGNPTMVDVAAKAISPRRAIAHARVEFPAAIGAQLLAAGFIGKKGAILHTAIIACIEH